MRKFLGALVLSLLAGSFVYAASEVKNIKEIFEPKGNFPASKFWKVAVVQINSKENAPLGAATKQIADYKARIQAELADKVREAAKNHAQFVVLPEFSAVGYPEIEGATPENDDYRNRDDVAPFVETIPGQTTAYFSKLAQELKVWIQFGMAEVEPKTNAYYNAAVVVNPMGEIVAKYHKQNLFGIENKFVSAGDTPVTFNTPAGKFGVAICADIYHKPALEQYKKLKVDVLSLSVSWAHPNTAMQNYQKGAKYIHSYVLAANQNYYPDSGVLNPDGTKQSHVRQTLNTIAYGYVPLKK